MKLEGEFEEEIGIDYQSGTPYFTHHLFEQWLIGHLDNIRRGKRIKFRAVVEIIEDE